MKREPGWMKTARDKGLVTEGVGVNLDDAGDLEPLISLVVVNGFPEPVKEYRFSKTRKFRFDLAWPDYGVGFERDGASFVQVKCKKCGLPRTEFKGRHHSRKGFDSDIEKMNLAASMGFLVVRATPPMLKNGIAAKALIDVLTLRMMRMKGVL